MTRRGSIVMLVLVGFGVAGCAGPLNQELSLADAVLLDTLTPDTPNPLGDKGLYPGGPYAGPPGTVPAGSVVGLSRENWTPMVFLVPVDSVEHQPLYAVHPRYTLELARQRNEYPDQMSALELPGDESRRDQALEALAAPFYSGLDIVMVIPRAVQTPPWTTVESPRQAYERAPRLTPGDAVTPPPVEAAPPESDGVESGGVGSTGSAE